MASVVNEFVTSVDEYYGHYLDTTSGYLANVKQMLDRQERTRAAVPAGTDLDSLGFLYGHGDPNDPANRLLHQTTQGEFKRRNARGGRNGMLASHQLIVLLYSIWEHEYRPRLSHALGLTEPNELKIPLLGDLRLLRGDVIHHRGIVTRETVEKLSVLSGFKEGAEITLAEDSVEALTRAIKAAMDAIVVQAGAPDPLHRKLWHVK